MLIQSWTLTLPKHSTKKIMRQLSRPTTGLFPLQASHCVRQHQITISGAAVASFPFTILPFSNTFQPLENRIGFWRHFPLQNNCNKNHINIISRGTTEAITLEDQQVGCKAGPKLMIVSHLDFTMVDHEDSWHKSLLNFNSLWAAEYAHNSTLVYSTGRSPERYNELRRQVPLLTPAVLVLSVGTEIIYGQSQEPDRSWLNLLDQRWNRDIVLEEANMFPQLQLQIDVKVIFSGGIAYDVLPKMGGKGEALAYLMRKMNKEGWLSKNVLVCGDSGNDTELFTVEGVSGVIVSNAQEELIQWYRSSNLVNNIYHASHRCAGGIVQALQHFEFGPHISPREKIKDNKLHHTEAELKSERSLEDGLAKREVIEFNVFLEMWLNGHLQNDDKAYQRIMNVISNDSTMVYPWGKESNLKEALDVV